MKSKSIKIMLAGSVPKGDNEKKDFIDWKKEYILKITKEIPNAKFLYGELINEKVATVGYELLVGHDLWIIKHCDLMIANTVSKMGPGTAQEIILAKIFKKPVISIIPKDTHHRKSNIIFGGVFMKEWIHPFLVLSSDLIVENINEAIHWIKSYNDNPKSIKIKNISVFYKAISNFEKKLTKNTKSYKKQGW